jgi:iron complex transport system substrate-binding protein
MRIASLIASSTELVCALGFGDDLVGRSHECDHPEWVRLPTLTEIDQRIKAILQEGLAVYRVFVEKLEAVRPEVILTQSQCEVCAVSLSDVEDAVCRMVSSQPRIVSLEPNDLAGVFRDIRKVAEALGAPGAGARLVASLRKRMAAVESTARRLASRPRVACIEWIEPLNSGGNWMPELVAIASARLPSERLASTRPGSTGTISAPPTPTWSSSRPAVSIFRVSSPKCRSSRSSPAGRSKVP